MVQSRRVQGAGSGESDGGSQGERSRRRRRGVVGAWGLGARPAVEREPEVTGRGSSGCCAASRLMRSRSN